LTEIESGKGDLGYCLAQVRRFDRDRYLTALFAPSQARPDLLAVLAFNLELARARELVREPMMGLVRLQWWRDAVAEMFEGKVRRHQVAQPLAEAVRRRRLSRAHFERLIEARERDLDPEPPADMAALLDYAEGTAATLNHLLLEVLAESGTTATAELRDAAGRTGIAWALSGLLRAVPFHARARRIMLPRTVMVEAGLRAEELLELRPSAALSKTVAMVAGEAKRCLGNANLSDVGPARRLRPVFLPAVMAAADLRRLKRAGFNPFDPGVQRTPPARIWSLLPAAFLGRF
jgi:phytoene synthase